MRMWREKYLTRSVARYLRTSVTYTENIAHIYYKLETTDIFNFIIMLRNNQEMMLTI